MADARLDKHKADPHTHKKPSVASIEHYRKIDQEWRSRQATPEGIARQKRQRAKREAQFRALGKPK
jgi:hypothetical protein